MWVSAPVGRAGRDDYNIDASIRGVRHRLAHGRRLLATTLAGSLMSDAQRLFRVHKTEKFLNLFAAQPDLDQLPGVDPPEVGIGKQALVLLGGAYDQLDPRPAE